MSQSDGFSGSLSTLPLGELLAKLHVERASGEVELETPVGSGSVWLVDGELHDAHLHPHRGLAALDRLLELQRGAFRFKLGSQSLRRSLFDAFEPIVAGHGQREAKRAALIRRLLVTNLSLVLDREMLGDAELDSGDERCQLLQLVNGQRTASQVVEQSQLPPAEALRDLADWYDLGVLKPHSEEGLQAPATRRGPALEHASSSASERVVVEPTPHRPTPKVPPNERAASSSEGLSHVPASHDGRAGPRPVIAAVDSRATARPDPPDAAAQAQASSSARTIPEVPAPRSPWGEQQESRPRSDARAAAARARAPSSGAESTDRSSAVRTLLAFPSPVTAFANQAAARHPLADADAAEASRAANAQSEPPTSGPVAHGNAQASAARYESTSTSTTAGTSAAQRGRLNSRTLLGFPSAVPSTPASDPSSPQLAPAASGSSAQQPADQLGVDDRLALFDKSVCLSRGRDAATYLVLRDDQVFVLKAPRSGTARQLQRIAREAQLLSRLSHSNLARLRESAERGTAPFLLMDYIDGLTLAELLATQHPLSPEVALSIVHDLLAGLRYLHQDASIDGSSGLIHANLEPTNVMVGLDGRARLIDLGEARRPGGDHAETEAHAEARFSSPELLAGEPLHPASDLYSLGMIMQALAPKLPSPSSRRTSDETANLVQTFTETAQRATARDPGRRYRSASEMALALGLSLDANPRHEIVRDWIARLPDAAPDGRPVEQLLRRSAPARSSERTGGPAERAQLDLVPRVRLKPLLLVLATALLLALAIYLLIRATSV